MPSGLIKEQDFIQWYENWLNKNLKELGETDIENDEKWLVFNQKENVLDKIKRKINGGQHAI